MGVNSLISSLFRISVKKTLASTYVWFRSIRTIRTLILAALVAALGLQACKGPSFEEGKKLFDQGYYGQAAFLLEEYSKDSEDKRLKQEATYLAAEAYRLNSDYEKAKRLYDKVLKTDPKNTKALIARADMLKNLEQYREAIDAYNTYLEEIPGDSMAFNRMVGCEWALQWTEDSSRYEVSYFKEANTRISNDWAPMMASKRDDVLFFTTDREGGATKRIYSGTMNFWTDVWYMQFEKGKKGKPGKWNGPFYLDDAKDATIKFPNTDFNEGAMTFDNRYQTMYMTQCGGRDGKQQMCGIYEYKKRGNEWIMGSILDFCAEDSAHSYGHPALSPDGNTLYFSSNRDGGYGGFDIYAVTYSRRSKKWSDPVNLGPNINTRGDEYFPYINPHNNKLYFSTDGLPTLGGLDMYEAEPTDNIQVWREVENLREPLNSGGDDFGITFYNGDPNKGFFTSNRGDRKNNDDIYAFDVTPLLINIQGVVTDCNTKKPLIGATVIITNDRDSVVASLKTDSMGAYYYDLKEKTNYKLIAKHPELYYFDGPLTERTTWGIRFSTTLYQDFCLTSPIDEILTLPIFYDLDKANIRPDAAAVLDTFARNVLMKYPKLIAELGSHTDCRASVDYNVNLAQRRADSARNYLMQKYGIDSSRIVAVGYGELELVNDCKCEGQDVVGMTPYIKGQTKKMIVVKDRDGNVRMSYYEEYQPSEIKIIGDKSYVACDEYQHQQNRRTTVRFAWEGTESRAKVNVNIDLDRNNTNEGKATKDSAAAQEAATPEMDLSTAIPLTVSSLGGKDAISVMVNNVRAEAFAYDFIGRYTAVPAVVAAEWLKSGLINKGSFLDGDKVMAVDPNTGKKIKLPSNKFVIDQMTVGDYIVKNVSFQITDKVDVPTLGKNFFKVFKPESPVKDGKLYLLPKRPPRAARPSPASSRTTAPVEEPDSSGDDEGGKKKKRN